MLYSRYVYPFRLFLSFFYKSLCCCRTVATSGALVRNSAFSFSLHSFFSTPLLKYVLWVVLRVHCCRYFAPGWRNYTRFQHRTCSPYIVKFIKVLGWKIFMMQLGRQGPNNRAHVKMWNSENIEEFCLRNALNWLQLKETKCTKLIY